MPDLPVGRFIGDYTLHEPGVGEGIEPDDFLIVPDATTPFSFVDETGQVIVTIDRPFITDGATTPWFLQIFRWLRRYGEIRRAAFLHDMMWARHHLGIEKFGFFKTNAIFYKACQVCGLTKVQAGSCWLAITLFGWHMWLGKNKRRAQAAACVNLARVVMRQRGIKK